MCFILLLNPSFFPPLPLFPPLLPPVLLHLISGVYAGPEHPLWLLHTSLPPSAQGRGGARLRVVSVGVHTCVKHPLGKWVWKLQPRKVKPVKKKVSQSCVVLFSFESRHTLLSSYRNVICFVRRPLLATCYLYVLLP